MFNVANLPAVRAQLERDAASVKEAPAPGEQVAKVEYARAPDGGGHSAALRAQGGQR